MPDKLIIDGGILAGGLATRMNGLDKGLQLFQGRMLVQWVFDTINPFVSQTLINCNRHIDTYQKISPYICSDSISGFQGPLAGIHSILESSDADYFLISPCDTPRLKPGFVTKMLETLRSNIASNTQAHPLLAVNTPHKQQPLHLCIAATYKHSLADYLHRGGHRVMQWMQENNAQWVDFSDHPEQFQNFNYLEDLK